MANKGLIIVIIGLVVGIVLGVAVMAVIDSLTNNTNSNTPTATPEPTAMSSTSTPTAMPASTTSYVEVDYQTVGWFYGTGLPDANYNYTYLVLNVTITNHGYSQVNAAGSNGLSVVINNNSYQPYPFDLYWVQTAEPNANITGLEIFGFNFSPSLPCPATLLDTGSINGLVIFQFGEPTIYPHPVQILNEPFTLQYSVTYGSDATLSVPNSTVIINQR